MHNFFTKINYPAAKHRLITSITYKAHTSILSLHLHMKDKSWIIGEYITRVVTKHPEDQSCQSKHHTQVNPDSSMEALVSPKFKNHEHLPLLPYPCFLYNFFCQQNKSPPLINSNSKSNGKKWKQKTQQPTMISSLL